MQKRQKNDLAATICEERRLILSSPFHVMREVNYEISTYKDGCSTFHATCYGGLCHPTTGISNGVDAKAAQSNGSLSGHRPNPHRKSMSKLIVSTWVFALMIL